MVRDPVFRGDPRLQSPEELLLAAVASCHMLTYLAPAAAPVEGRTGWR